MLVIQMTRFDVERVSNWLKVLGTLASSTLYMRRISFARPSSQIVSGPGKILKQEQSWSILSDHLLLALSNYISFSPDTSI